MASAPLHIQRACILTMNDAFDVIEGDVLIEGGRIRSVGRIGPPPPGTVAIDAAGDYLLPGFVQTHVHLCQTLFRGYADDLSLLDWLRTRIWPLEAAHTPASLRAATALAAAELLQGGTTSVLTMETVHDTDAVFEALEPAGLRAVVGKCMMDAADQAVPSRLIEETRASIDESLAMARRWNGRANGRLRAALAPRFAVSCSDELLEAVAGCPASTDCWSTPTRLRAGTKSRSCGRVPVVPTSSTWPRSASSTAYLPRPLRMGGRGRAAIAGRAAGSRAALPGIQPQARVGPRAGGRVARARRIVSLGADGAACNNHLDMFQEMRLAATLQAVRLGPGALPAREVLAMATRGGARCTGHGLGDRRRSTPGFRADLILVRSGQPHQVPAPDPYTALVYATRPTDVRTTIVDGEVLVSEGTPVRWDAREVVATARAEARALASRAGL